MRGSGQPHLWHSAHGLSCFSRAQELETGPQNTRGLHHETVLQSALLRPRAGQENPTFLDADAFQGAFLEPLAPYLDQVGVFLI